MGSSGAQWKHVRQWVWATSREILTGCKEEVLTVRGLYLHRLPVGTGSAWRCHGISVLAELGWLRPWGASCEDGPALKSLRAPEVAPNLNHRIITPMLNFLANYFQHLVVEFQLKSKPWILNCTSFRKT